MLYLCFFNFYLFILLNILILSVFNVIVLNLVVLFLFDIFKFELCDILFFVLNWDVF